LWCCRSPTIVHYPRFSADCKNLGKWYHAKLYLSAGPRSIVLDELALQYAPLAGNPTSRTGKDSSGMVPQLPSPIVKPANGRLGVLLPGLGAVATTFIAGVMAVRRQLGLPVGSLTQMQTIRLGSRADNNSPKICDFLPLAKLDDLNFGAWDLHGEDALEVARRSQVLESPLLETLGEDLQRIRPMPAVFSRDYVRRLEGQHIKPVEGKRAQFEALRQDIRGFKDRQQCERVVVLWTGSTEVFRKPSAVHQSIAAFEAGLDANDPEISPSMLYAWAALHEGCSYANGAPNLALDTPALEQLSRERGLPIAGKDFKTGQTLLKTVLAPMLKMRMLGLTGWFSTNILGNRDGEVLLDPDSFKTKEESKLDVLNSILRSDMYPDLYKDIFHLVKINYYPPRGDAKEGWDNIDLFGWLGYPMQLKVNFLARDSILAAPLVLDLVLLLDLAARAGLSGPQDWLSFYFKTPQAASREFPVEDDVFIQHRALKNTMRWLGGEKPLTHLDFLD
jgi:myo-inositol-1-phosphate synthase